mmetsp:Transcript_635/g.1108  ORF Transcript_635/g.1108 Transcript_635/m.1108 type:complete len:213 (-) Transcript_635:2527-3165(-)
MNKIDFENYLIRCKILFCTGEINDHLCSLLIKNLLFYYINGQTTNTKMFINSTGGNIMSGMSIYDTINALRNEASTISLGISASMAAFLLASGTVNKRLALPNSRIMIHQPLGGIQGSLLEIEIQTKELLFHRNNLNYILAKKTGNTIEKIEQDTDRDKYFTPTEAFQYGLIDKVIGYELNVPKKFKNIKDYLKVKNELVNWSDFKYLKSKE